MRKVMHGDRVLANVTGIDRRGRREGSIARVLERGMTRLIGRFSVEFGINYVVPDDKRIGRNVQIPHDAIGEARDGQLVVCEITQAPDTRRPPIGKILTVLGDRLTPSLVVEAAIHGHELPFEFPQEVIDEAAAVPVDVAPAEITGRCCPAQSALRCFQTRSPRVSCAPWPERHTAGAGAAPLPGCWRSYISCRSSAVS